MTEHVAIPTTGGDLPVSLVPPASGAGPGIVLVQEIFGVSPYVLDRARDLAALGYTVAVPHLYWRVGADAVADDDPDLLARGMQLMQQLPWDDAVADTRATVAWLRQRPETSGRVAAVGFCYGGGVAYAAASGSPGEGRPDALVSYYGSALPMLVDTIQVVEVPSLHHFGTQDSYIPAEAVAHVREVVTRAPHVAFHTWPGADHAFDNTLPMFHHAEASQGAWQVTVDWLVEHFPA